jgi:hypothetical protein
MQPRLKLFLLSLGVLLLAIVAAALSAHRSTGAVSPLTSSYSTDARGCRAVFEMLERTEAIKPVRLENMYDLQDMRGMLVVAGPLKEPLTEEEAALILQWVRAGNGLLYFVGAEQPHRTYCALERTFCSPGEPEPSPVASYMTYYTAVLRCVMPVFLPARMVIYKGPMERLVPLSLKGIPILHGPTGDLAAWHPWGQGNVIVCATAGPIQNHLVRHADNVEFLLCCIKALRPPGGAVIFDEFHQGFQREVHVSGLLSASGVLVASAQLALCGLIYIVAQGRRMGPPLPLPAPGPPRRNTRHYLDAAGMLYMQHCRPGEVAAAYGEFVMRTLARRLGHEGKLDPSALAPLLARRLSADTAEIEALLADAARASQSEMSARQAAALVRKLDRLMQNV